MIKVEGRVRTRFNGASSSEADRVISMMDKIIEVVSSSDTLQRELAKVKLLGMALKDYRKGKYQEIPYKSIVAITGALLYIVSPWDIIPDYLPIIGQLDDLLVLALAWRMVAEDIKRYARWKIESTGDPEVKSLYLEAFEEEVFVNDERGEQGVQEYTGNS